MEEASRRRAMVAAGARLAARGLIAAAEGNLSLRLSDDRLLVTPSGRRKDELTVDELLIVPLAAPQTGDSMPRGARPSSDIRIHRAVMSARPDVEAVAHAHLPVSMALTLAGERPEPSVLPETAHFLPELPIIPFGQMGSADLADRIARTLAGPLRPGAAILERHGAIAVGAADGDADGALRQAVDRLELIEVLCRAWRDALLVRAARATVGPDG